MIACVGWNGVKVHCQGRAWELRKGDSFTSETEDADIMVDVHDARVLLRWPRHIEPKICTPSDSERSENSPRAILAAARQSPIQSPLRHQQRMHSPVSPSPAVHATSSTIIPSDPSSLPPVQVYEDEPADEEVENNTQTGLGETQSTLIATQPLPDSISNSFSDADEENDPVVHSFGPFGANIMPRLESFTTGDSPEARRPLNPLKESSISPQRQRDRIEEEEPSPIVNHVINQLAYSRLASTPVSTLMDNLPAHLKTEGSKGNTQLSMDSLNKMLDATPCIGKVSREGKDAAGKPLESEYYYIADMDVEVKRRNAVEGLQKPGLRACRKQHKVLFPPFPADITRGRFHIFGWILMV